MGRFIDLSGKTFGSWKVIERIFLVKNRTHWVCQCDCGIKNNVDGNNLRCGYSTKCKRCHNKLAITKRPLIHGNCKRNKTSKEYSVWSGMKSRCLNPNNHNYPSYGGRGISICKRWHKFENFLLDMGKCPPGLTLDRISNEKNYSKSNCKWATNKEQSSNKRSNKFLYLNGIKRTKTEWAKIYNMPFTSFARKVEKEGWPFK